MKVEKTNRQKVYDLTEAQKEKLKDYLTVDNPKYKSAKRYSRYKNVYLPKYLTYYNDHKDFISVPMGVNLNDILSTTNFEITDGRIDRPVKYPKFNLDLRNDQIKAEKQYFENLKQEYPKTIIQLPTGKGKSILALHIAYTLKQKTLVLVHKDDLVVGWTEDIKLCFGENTDIGLIKAKSRKIGSQITIATVQTLGRMSEEELNKYTDEFGLVVQDEVHHTGLNIFNIIDSFNSRYKLGLSATPKRSDGLDFVFDFFFGGIGYVHEVTKDDEDICGCEVRALYSNFKFKPFVYEKQVFNYYDFTEKELPTVLNFVEDIPYKDRPKIPYLNIDNEAVRSPLTKVSVCKKIIEHYRQGHSILALFTQKEHIDIYYRYLSKYIPKDKIMLYYGDSKEDSKTMMKKAEDKEVLVTLATLAKATEGTNVKSWEVLFLVSSINNEKNVEQAVGRIRRRKEGKLSTVIVYDVIYSECYSLRSHFSTREKVYNNLKFSVKGVKKKKSSLFSRGYGH